MVYCAIFLDICLGALFIADIFKHLSGNSCDTELKYAYNYKKSAIKTLFKRAETRLIYQLKTMLTKSFIAGCLAASAIAIGVPMYIPENYEAIEKYQSALAQTT